MFNRFVFVLLLVWVSCGLALPVDDEERNRQLLRELGLDENMDQETLVALLMEMMQKNGTPSDDTEELDLDWTVEEIEDSQEEVEEELDVGEEKETPVQEDDVLPPLPPHTDPLDYLSPGPRPLLWSEYVQLTTEYGCHTTHRETLQKLSYLRRSAMSPRALCTKPVVVLGIRLNDSCDGCHHFVEQVWRRFAAELSLLQRYVTFVYAPEPLTNTLLDTPLPLPLPFDVDSLVQEALDAAIQQHHLTDEEAVSLRREMQRQAWETVGHLQQDWRKDPKRVRYAVAALSGQQEYIPRVLFLYPHNGSVMRDVVNDYVRQGFPNNLHFYYSLPPFLNSIRKSIQIMSSVFEEAFS